MAAAIDNEAKNKDDVVEMLRDAINAGNEAWDAVNKFHGKFLEATYKAGMLTEIRAPFDHICQGIAGFHVMSQTRIFAYLPFFVCSDSGLYLSNGFDFYFDLFVSVPN